MRAVVEALEVRGWVADGVGGIALTGHIRGVLAGRLRWRLPATDRFATVGAVTTYLYIKRDGQVVDGIRFRTQETQAITLELDACADSVALERQEAAARQQDRATTAPPTPETMEDTPPADDAPDAPFGLPGRATDGSGVPLPPVQIDATGELATQAAQAGNAYPEHVKMLGVRPSTEAAAAFVIWAAQHGYLLCEEGPRGRFRPMTRSLEGALAEWKGIDLNTLYAEKQRMRDEIARSLHAASYGAPVPVASSTGGANRKARRSLW